MRRGTVPTRRILRSARRRQGDSRLFGERKLGTRAVHEVRRALATPERQPGLDERYLELCTEVFVERSVEFGGSVGSRVCAETGSSRGVEEAGRKFCLGLYVPVCLPDLR